MSNLHNEHEAIKRKYDLSEKENKFLRDEVIDLKNEKHELLCKIHQAVYKIELFKSRLDELEGV